MCRPIERRPRSIPAVSPAWLTESGTSAGRTPGSIPPDSRATRVWSSATHRPRGPLRTCMPSVIESRRRVCRAASAVLALAEDRTGGSRRADRDHRGDHGGVAGEWPRLRDGVHRWFDRRLHGGRGDARPHPWVANGPEGHRRVLDIYASCWPELLDAVSHTDGMTRAISARAA